jgi:hypothetical protein
VLVGSIQKVATKEGGFDSSGWGRSGSGPGANGSACDRARAKAEVDTEFAMSVARQADIDSQRIAARPVEFDHNRAKDELSPAEREAQDQALRRQQERAERLWGVKFDDQIFSTAVESLNAES